MAKSHSSNFVNGARNIVLLSGYARRNGADSLLLMQSDNEKQHLTVQIKRTTRPIRPDIPYQVRCHVRGERIGNQHRITLEAIEAPARAPISAAPRRLLALNALRQGLGTAEVGAGFNPFANLDGVREEIAQQLAAQHVPEAVVEEMLRDTRKSPTIERFVNHVVLSGFVGHKAFYPPPDGAPPDHGYCLFLVHQHPDPARGVPIRVRGADSRFLRLLPVMHPVNVVATVRMVQIVGEGGQGEAQMVLEATRENVGGAVASDFEHQSFPGWWAQAVQAYHAQRLATRASKVGDGTGEPRVVGHTDELGIPFDPDATF